MYQTFGIIGMGVMGKSLARNLASKGYKLSLYNRYSKGIEENIAIDFINSFEELSEAKGFEDLNAFVQSLEKPRKILLMVKAGDVVDHLIEKLIPILNQNDIIIDGGNSHYKDTERRMEYLDTKGIGYIGSGVSGGEEGALKGPSIMPGGKSSSYKEISKILESIAAKDSQGAPCCAFIGSGGAGHFVKMVHNGIEYAEMQLIAEVYSLMRFGLLLDPLEISAIFKEWNNGTLSSYLLGITADILTKKEGDNYLIDLILDKAGNKGTGSWTSIAAAELGVSISMINEALFARYISAFKEERVKSDAIYNKVNRKEIFDLNVDQIRNAYTVARIVNHHQGMHLMSAASETYKWSLNLSEIARIWTNGCIIRSQLMQNLISILNATDRILHFPDIVTLVNNLDDDIKEVTAIAITNNHSVPCFSAACNYLSAYTNKFVSANIIQAQRDYFGAHTYKRVDDESDTSYHTNWNE